MRRQKKDNLVLMEKRLAYIGTNGLDELSTGKVSNHVCIHAAAEKYPDTCFSSTTCNSITSLQKDTSSSIGIYNSEISYGTILKYEQVNAEPLLP